MFSASKLYQSVSTSGPSTTVKPRPMNTFLMSSSTSVSGCRRPSTGPRPGSVTSMVSSFSRASRAAAASVSLRRPMRVSSSSRKALTSWPTWGRSSGGTLPMPRKSSVTFPFRPRYCTRSCSTSSGRSAASRAATASSRSRAILSRTAPQPFASIVPRRPHRPTRLGVQQKKPHSRPGTEGDSRGTTLVNPGPDGPEFPHCPITVRVRHGLLDRLAPGAPAFSLQLESELPPPAYRARFQSRRGLPGGAGRCTLLSHRFCRGRLYVSAVPWSGRRRESIDVSAELTVQEVRCDRTGGLEHFPEKVGGEHGDTPTFPCRVGPVPCTRQRRPKSRRCRDYITAEPPVTSL